MTELYVWPAPDPATCVLAVRSWRRSDYPRPSRPNRRRKLDRDAELVALFDAGGVTQHQLAERFGISHQRVSQILKNAGRDPLGRQR
jgi:hypothetical protein